MFNLKPQFQSPEILITLVSLLYQPLINHHLPIILPHLPFLIILTIKPPAGHRPVFPNYKFD